MTNSRNRPFYKKIGLFLASAVFPLAMHAAIINVSNSSQLSSAVGSANPGDTIVMANGNYSGFTITRSGNASSQITIQAANVGSAVINSGTVQLNGCSYVNLDGIKFTTSGGSATVDGVTRYFGVLLDDASHCRVTRCTFALSGAHTGNGWITLGGNSQHNEIDHSEFGPNSVGGHTHYIFPTGSPTISGVTPPSDRTSWANGNGPYNPNMARYTQIDHNYFHDMGSGDGETIVPGGVGVCGDYQGTMTTVENNLFVNCNGDPEVVSIKSSTNTVRFNTFITCQGVVSFRSGNGSAVYGNFFLCGGVSGSGGVKINEMHHKVYDNYIQDAGSYPIMLEDGDFYDTNNFAHGRVVDAEVEYNTIVNPANEVLVGHTSTRPLKPTGCFLANNIITGSGTLFHETSGSSVTYSQNIINGYNPNKSGFIVENPSLTTISENSYNLQKLSSGSPAIGNADTSYFSYVTTDMDGQSRSSFDIGADEYSTGSISITPLKTSDVGPASGGGIIGGGGGPLPSGWTDADIGSVGVSGSASYDNGTFTVSGSGSDIWGTADGFHYAYQSASGDTTVIARVASEDGSQSYAKAGVMIRESTASGSVHASVLLTPGNGVAMEIRPTTGASSINITGWISGVLPPQWVKLVRSGNTFTGYYSANGSSWTQIASTNVTMSSSAIAGLAASAHDTSSLNTATFDNVSIGGSGGGDGIDTTAIYQIQNVASGLVLNNQGKLTNGSPITQWSTGSTSDNLRWTFIPTSNGYYQINSVKSGLDAVVQSASTANGAGIIQWSFGSSGNDQWLPVQNGDGSYTFYNLHSGKVLEDPGGSTSTSTQMDQWDANGGSNQKWNLLKQ